MTEEQTLEFMTQRIQSDLRLADKTPDKLPERLAKAYTRWVKGIANAITAAGNGGSTPEDKQQGGPQEGQPNNMEESK